MQPEAARDLIARWKDATGSERANYQLFVTDLCRWLGVALPDPARSDTRENAYVFERQVTFAHGDGGSSLGFIDCYKRGAFVLEAKKIKAGAHTRGFDDALMRARAQAENYARALPAAEGRPPFLVIVDVGHVIELFAEFTRSGATYTPFPDARSHRIALDDLRDDAVQQRLRLLWTDPMALDPSRASAKVTREVAARLADLARSLEGAGHGAEKVAGFLTRCLFSMFAEDVNLLPKTDAGDGAFVALLKRHRDDPRTLQRMLAVLWTDMDHGGFSAVLAKDVLRFNGKLFKGWQAADYALPLTREQIDGLLAAASASWREVEPAIFGTLLERALDPEERHALGAHYTPRAYVERLVLPTVVEPLRADWANAQAAAHLLASEANALEGRKRDDKLAEARAEIHRFHRQLCATRVLDPACGSGNFLYVTLEHLKRLEGEVMAQLEALGDTQAKLGLEGETVTLKQLLGIEINERAAALAELVLWIGYLQWHIRTFGNASVVEPVIHDYGNIEHRDAVLASDGQEPMRDASGALVTRWDGKTFKTHPVTGEPVPDESALVLQWRYLNPRPATWPAADFIVGNPPFIGNKRMREALGDGYVQALRGSSAEVGDTADFVMYWWRQAAMRVAQGVTRRFGLITTNSITQTFNQKVVERAGIGIAFAVPDHPWVDTAGGAAVRVAMTVGVRDPSDEGVLLSVQRESAGDGETAAIDFRRRVGHINQNLTMGVNVAAAQRLRANAGISFMGMIPLGAGFWIDRAAAERLGLGRVTGMERHVRRYRNGRDLTGKTRDLLALDFYGVTEDGLRDRFPEAYQWLLERVKPSRDTDNRESRRRNWWTFAESVPKFRLAAIGLRRYIGTAETAKHRTFVFIESDILPDQKIRAIAHQDAFILGVLSSAAHLCWTDATGSTLEDRPVYNNTRCFEPFPFPSDDSGLTPHLTDRIRRLAESIDAHRKTRQAAHADLTLTGMYNVLSKLRSTAPLSAPEKTIHDRGLVAVLRSLHDDLDMAVLAAYGWADLQPALADYTPAGADARAAAVETLLERLVALNARRAAEEAAGTIRWLRPEFQDRARQGEQTALEVETEEPAQAPAAVAAPMAKRPWPAGLPEQIKGVAEVLASSNRPLALADLEARFAARGRWRDRLPVIVETLEALGRARRVGDAVARWQAI